MTKNSNLENMIVAEKEKLEKLETKQAELLKKIKLCKSNLEKYEMMKNNQRYNALANSLDNKGISFDDIISALSAGDLLSLQEKIEHTVEKEDKE